VSHHSAHIERNSAHIEQDSVQIKHLGHMVAEVAEGQRRNADGIGVLVNLVGGILEGRSGGGEASRSG
jgi:hypothetical protein